MAYTWLNQLGGYNLASTSYSVDDLPSNPSSNTITAGNTPVDTDANSNWYINTNVKIAHSKTSAVWLFYIDDEENNVNLVKVSGINASYIITFTFLIAIDYENQKAYAIPIVNYSNQWMVYDWEFSEADTLRFYQLIKDDIPPLYNWQSVQSISGKNGILSLEQIKEEYINDGESVSGASADHFTNLSTENRVDVLIDDALPAPEIGGTTVTVKYTIPSLSTGSYEYCKLVAKKNSMPESAEDGDKIINIDPTAVSVLVKNLKGHTKYYFVIFIKDSNDIEASSEPKSITTQGAVIPEEYQPYLDLLALTAWGTNSDMTLLTYLNRRGNSSTSVVSSDHSFATRDNFNNNSNCYAFSVLQMSTINISTDPITVLYTCNVAEYDIIKTSGRDMWGVYSENGNGGDYITAWGAASGISSPVNTDGLMFTPTTSFSSLGDCLVYLTQHFRHVNVKVDGEYWLKLD